MLASADMSDGALRIAQSTSPALEVKHFDPRTTSFEVRPCWASILLIDEKRSPMMEELARPEEAGFKESW